MAKCSAVSTAWQEHWGCGQAPTATMSDLVHCALHTNPGIFQHRLIIDVGCQKICLWLNCANPFSICGCGIFSGFQLQHSKKNRNKTTFRKRTEGSLNSCRAQQKCMRYMAVLCAWVEGARGRTCVMAFALGWGGRPRAWQRGLGFAQPGLQVGGQRLQKGPRCNRCSRRAGEGWGVGGVLGPPAPRAEGAQRACPPPQTLHPINCPPTSSGPPIQTLWGVT